MRDPFIQARSSEGETSDVAPVPEPFAGVTLVLRLEAGAALEIEVREPRGEPAVGRSVSLIQAGPMRQHRRYETTDAKGKVRFQDQHDGPHEVWVAMQDRERSHRVPVELVRAQVSELVIELPDDDSELALEGLVVDEEGRPLADVAVSIEPAGSWWSTQVSDGGGRFRFVHPPCEGLRLVVGVEPGSDRFEPAALDLAWGTRDILLRRVERAEQVSLPLRVLDSRSREALVGFTIVLDRGDRLGGWGRATTTSARIDERALPGDVFTILATGYVPRTLPLLESAHSLPENGILEVLLEPGLDLEVVVIDGTSFAPLQGARLRAPDGRLARTDSEGRVRLVAQDWASWQVELEGFQVRTFEPDSALRWGDRRIRLTPLTRDD